MAKEFLKLENKLILELEIEPISPLIVTMGSGRNEDEESGESSIITFMTTENPRLPKEIKLENGEKKKIKETKDFVIYNQDNDNLEKDYREGEPFILGSILRGLFREKFNQIYDIKYKNESPRINKKKNDTENKEDKDKKQKKEIIKYDEVENLFGYIKNDIGKKGRIFLDDAYLKKEYREIFYSENENKKLEIKRKIFKTRSITPIDAFTGKAIVPLKVEYTDESFFTTLTINNVTKEELKNIYFIIRDSHLGEIRIGNSKTRGFGQIKLNIKKFIFEDYKNNILNFSKEIEDKNNTKFIQEFETNFFVLNRKKSIELGDKYLKKSLELKEEFYDLNVEKPNQFILKLFGEVE